MINNIRYKGNINNTSVIIFESLKLPAMVLCFGEPPRRFLWCCSSFHFWSSFCCSIFISFLIFILQLFFIYMFFILSLFSFTFPFRRHPSPFCGLSSGFYTHFILSVQPIAEWFATLSFPTIPLIFLSQALQPWVGIFYPQAFFTLCSPSPAF